MTERTPRQLTKTWIILVLMVLAGLLLSLKVQSPAAPLVLTLALLMLAVLKARLVVLDFLGLRSGPRVLRIGLIAWPLFFALAAAAKALIAAVSLSG
ncbi:cytochrome C oxidase subunit IV family protein [Sinorhizobium fredii]|uniref:cytochrome C oxidase subunit IV family protein n=1 Tax=Rhizobium fredii TaxID=380 RepID=UPI0005956038|nr:cytochrome C oxidase subunit IV family protein [Sinorhizobium fredii]WOS63896.1 cytochrome C oxidase subunit IV family protein [Sinorhizobium fredii GR64]